MMTDADRMGGMTGIIEMNVAGCSRWLRRIPAILVLAALVAPGCPSCPLVDPPDVANCDVESPPVEAVDPCLGGAIIATVTVPRDAGPPNAGAVTFRLPAASELCVEFIITPNEGGRVISSGRAAIDDVKLAARSDFNQNVAAFVRRTTAEAGEHELTVEVASVPGAVLTVNVRSAFVVTPAHEASANELARLQGLTCEETNESTSVIGPEETERRIESLESVGIIPGRLRILTNAYGVPTYLSPLPSLTLSGTTPLERAEDWLAQELVLFRLDDPRHALVPIGVNTRPDGSSRVGFQQVTDGLTVDRARLYLYLDSLGFVRKVAGNATPDIAPGLAAIVTEQEAVTLARAASGAGLTDPVLSVELVYLDLADLRGIANVALAWRVELGGARSTGTWIDAETGEALHVGLGDASISDIRIIDQATGTTLFDEAAGVGPCLPGSDCEIVFDAVFLQRANWFIRHNRTGWSGDGSGMSGTMPDEEFVTKLNFPGVDDDLELWNTGLHELRFSDTPGVVHEDLVWHGFCHGFNQVNTDVSSFSPFDTVDAAINEHVADACALLLGKINFQALPLRIETNISALPTVRDHVLDECDSYDPLVAPCDVRVFGERVHGCREFLHLGNFQQSATVGLPPVPAPDPPHENSCIFTRPLSLLLQPGPTRLHRGITVNSGMDPFLADLVYHKLFTSLTNNETVFMYPAHLIDAALDADALCSSNPMDDPCITFPVGTRTILGDVGLALDAAGFWSPPMTLTPAAGTGVSPLSSIAGVETFGGTKVLFFTTNTPPIGIGPKLVLFTEPDGDFFNATPGIVQTVEPLLAPGEDPGLLVSTSAVSASINPLGSTITVAFVGLTGQAHVLTAPSSMGFGSATIQAVSSVFPLNFSPFLPPQVSVASTNSDVFLVYVHSSGELRSTTPVLPGTYKVISTSGVTVGHTLVFDPASQLLHVLWVQGSPGSGLLFHSSLDTTDVLASWSTPTQVNALEDGLEAVLSATGTALVGPPGNPDLSRPVIAEYRPSAVIFRDHIQLLYGSTLPGTATLQPAHLTIPLQPTGAPDFSGISRELHLPEAFPALGGLLGGTDEIVGFWKLLSGVRMSRKRSE